MPSPPDGTFPHQRLDAYHVALQMAVDARRLAAKLPKADRNLRDQLERAATSAVLNLAEGANRWSRADKSARFAVARGECGEGTSPTNGEDGERSEPGGGKRPPSWPPSSGSRRPRTRGGSAGSRPGSPRCSRG